MTLCGPQRLAESHLDVLEPWESERKIALSGLENGVGEVLGWDRMWRHPTWMLKVKPTATELPLPPSVKIHTNEGVDPFPTEWTEIPRAFRTA